MTTFHAQIGVGLFEEVDAQVIGQLAIHHPVSFTEDDPDTSRWMISHVKTGSYFWEFDGGTLESELVRLAHLLAAYDFDAYVDGGYMDKQFVADVKDVIGKWKRGEL